MLKKEASLVIAKDVVVKAPPAILQMGLAKAPAAPLDAITVEDQIAFLRMELKAVYAELENKTVAANTLARIAAITTRHIQDANGGNVETPVTITQEQWAQANAYEVTISGDAMENITVRLSTRTRHPIAEVSE